MRPPFSYALSALAQALDLVGGLSILLLPLFPLAVPGAVVLGLVLVPLAAVGILMALVGAILAAPYLLARSLRRRWAKPPTGTTRRACSPPCAVGGCAATPC